MQRAPCKDAVVLLAFKGFLEASVWQGNGGWDLHPWQPSFAQSCNPLALAAHLMALHNGQGKTADDEGARRTACGRDE